MNRIKYGMGFVFCLCMMFSLKTSVKADEWTDAYSFYTKYANDMVFQAKSKTNGTIYFATEAKLSNENVKYYPLGLVIEIKDDSNRIVQNIYYDITGKYITLRNTNRTAKSGYLYKLYMMSLSDLKSRMNEEATLLFNTGKASVSVNTCMTIEKDGALCGGMSDGGITNGNVYSSYDEIVNAYPWTDAEKEALRVQYDKKIRNLFYELTLNQEEGILAVTGQGTYCYGVQATIRAEAEKGYRFAYWYSNRMYTSPEMKMTMGADMAMTAYAKPKSIEVTYYRNLDEQDTESQKVIYSYNEKNTSFMQAEWVKDGYQLIGWSEDKTAFTTQFKQKQVIEGAWILEKEPQISLYAVWDEAPRLKISDLYYPLEWIKSGKITEQELASKAIIEDREDGVIPYGSHERNSFLLPDFRKMKYMDMEKENRILERYQVIDSAGNCVEKEIWVNFVDTEVKSVGERVGKVRLISEKYFENKNQNLIPESEGGLDPDSCWVKNPEYRKLLRLALVQ